MLASTAPTLSLPTKVAGAAESRELRFSHLHTREQLEVTYWKGGRYLPSAMADIRHLLRDFRTGQARTIDPRLLDLLHDLKRATGSRKPFEVISGYRSPATNRQLRARSEGVAGASLHMQGRAIDIRLGDVALATLRDTARAMKRGGVGYYAASNFVHVDTGRVRTW
ncbi:MAG: DUF882 domain-containing protein [Luteitalea sp.]